jgi:hypothetical protein
VANPSSNGKPPAKQSDDDIINNILGGQPVQTPPDIPKDPATGKDALGKDGKPLPGPGMAMSIPPAFFKLIGHALAKATKVDEFELDNDCATYLADCLKAALAAKGVVADPMMMFIVAMAMWIGGGVITFIMRKFENGELGGEDGGILGGLFGRKEKKTTPMAPPQTILPPIPTTPQIQTPMMTTIPTVQTQATNDKWHPTDLGSLEQQAAAKMAREIAKTKAKT